MRPTFSNGTFLKIVVIIDEHQIPNIRNLLLESGGIQLEFSGDGLSVITKWEEKTLDSHMHGLVMLDNCIYVTIQSGNKSLVYPDWKKGKVMWNAQAVKMAVVVSADEHWDHPTW